nr:MAG TPA: hypothetical protein [Caudoviricetes sp.]
MSRCPPSTGPGASSRRSSAKAAPCAAPTARIRRSSTRRSPAQSRGATSKTCCRAGGGCSTASSSQVERHCARRRLSRPPNPPQISVSISGYTRPGCSLIGWSA